MARRKGNLALVDEAPIEELPMIGDGNAEFQPLPDLEDEIVEREAPGFPESQMVEGLELDDEDLDLDDQDPEEVASDEASQPITTVNGVPVFRVPQESEFDDLMFLDAPSLTAIADRLINDKEDTRHSHLGDVEITYLWKKKGGQKKGHAILGMTAPATPLVQYLSGSDVDYVIWVAWDHVKNAHFTAEQVEALIYHELCHISWDSDKEKTFMVGHDFEGFLGELQKYGAWDTSFQELVPIAAEVAGRQLSLDLND